ncbi:NUDIX hydrolase [Rhizobium sp. RU36D]|uniref:NUDIX hydrolase n=1 Tax=Rhizobium sp. RU36D TaxID=1907415 RepID=UPI0015C4AECD|nr:NUDIX hydrolase [Rhizobium sp. RU36D]
MTLLDRIAEEMQLMLRRPSRQQYAALCYRLRKPDNDLEVLLLTSRDTGRWVIPKGWPMSGKDCYEVAEREAFEEAGVKGKVRKKPLGHFTYLKSLDGGLKIPCRVQVHAMEVRNEVKDFKEKGMRKSEWVTCEEAATRVNEPELKALIRGFKEQMLQGKFSASA